MAKVVTTSRHKARLQDGRRRRSSHMITACPTSLRYSFQLPESISLSSSRARCIARLIPRTQQIGLLIACQTFHITSTPNRHHELTAEFAASTQQQPGQDSPSPPQPSRRHCSAAYRSRRGKRSPNTFAEWCRRPRQGPPASPRPCSFARRRACSIFRRTANSRLAAASSSRSDQLLRIRLAGFGRFQRLAALARRIGVRPSGAADGQIRPRASAGERRRRRCRSRRRARAKIQLVEPNRPPAGRLRQALGTDVTNMARHEAVDRIEAGPPDLRVRRRIILGFFFALTTRHVRQDDIRVRPIFFR